MRYTTVTNDRYLGCACDMHTECRAAQVWTSCRDAAMQAECPRVRMQVRLTLIVTGLVMGFFMRLVTPDVVVC